MALVGLMAAVTIMLIAMAVGVPGWRYIMKDSNEQELLFRGNQIAAAIRRYQTKNANALPPSLEVLVKGKYLRRLYKDPMTRSGEWRLLHQGETQGAPTGLPPGLGPGPGGSTTTTTTTTQPARFGPTVGGTIGLITGVASQSTDQALRLVNGRSHYNEWLFVAGQQLVAGRPPGQLAPGAGLGPGTSPRPGGTPSR